MSLYLVYYWICVSSLKSVTVLIIYTTHCVGTIPESLSAFSNLTTLNLGNNNLHGTFN